MKILSLLIAGALCAVSNAATLGLAWTDNSAGETGFAIERSFGANSTVYTEVGRVAANVTTYTDPNLVDNTVYNYRVRAVLINGYTAYSNVATGSTSTVPPPVNNPPSGLQVIQVVTTVAISGSTPGTVPQRAVSGRDVLPPSAAK